ncbi:MAG: N-acetylmuramoyl-L-alanine amidase [Chloroflexi bacterium]|nr:N-acetylmuramoyl-L-alanine amidase [Chloroflexota bacterium]
MLQFGQFIFGMHDSGGAQLMVDAGKPGWVLVSVKATDSPGDYSTLANQGLGIIGRLNHGYESDGTIPHSAQYDAFAQRCANFVAGSRGANIWIIGNETNLAAERPGNTGGNDGEFITPDKYAQCFAKCRAAILAVAGHAQDLIAPAPPGPWNPQTTYPGNPGGDWVKYYQDILNLLAQMGAPPGALALHTYTHGFDAGLIASEDKVLPAFPNYHFHFRAYRDFLNAVPAVLRGLPVFITEAQPADPSWWQNRNIGWVRAAYAEINAWNAVAANQPIQALCLFRWDRGDDRWSISEKSAVLDDFRGALQNDYRVRMPAPVGTPPTPVKPKPKPTESGWCPFAIKRPVTENNYDVGRSGHKVKAVVLHIAAGPMTAVFPTFNNPQNLASAHFCVGKDGTIEQYVSMDDTAYGNGLKFSNGQWFNARGVVVKPTWQDLQPPHNPNLYTVSVEHDGQPQNLWTPEMYEANNRLLIWIGQQCGITYVPHRTLVGHFEINSVDRPNCPGPNVNYEQICADANAGLAGTEPPTPASEAILAAASEVALLPINVESALFKFAQARGLGCPQSDETDFQIGGDAFVCQVFMGGIIYVKKGDWGNIHFTPKVEGDVAMPADATAAAAVAAAKKRAWLPINTDGALYKFAQANRLGCPQSNEFEFAVETDYLGQVFAKGFVYVKKGDWGNIKWSAKVE